MTERAPEPGDAFLFASRKARIYAAFGPLVIGGTVIAISALAATGLWKLLAIPALIVLAAVLWRAVRVSLALRYETVVVRNTFRTYELRWSDIKHVTFGQGAGWSECVAFARKGSRLVVEAVATSDECRNEQLLDQLGRYAEPHGIPLDPEILERLLGIMTGRTWGHGPGVRSLH